MYGDAPRRVGVGSWWSEGFMWGRYDMAPVPNVETQRAPRGGWVITEQPDMLVIPDEWQTDAWQLYLDAGTLDMGILRAVIGWRTVLHAALRPWRWHTIPGLIRRWHQPVVQGNDFTMFTDTFMDEFIAAGREPIDMSVPHPPFETFLIRGPAKDD